MRSMHASMDEHEREILERHPYYPNYDLRTAVEVQQDHDLDLLGRVVPDHINRVQASQPVRPVAIMDLGCGLGIFNDQIRLAFGDAVDVCGTSLLRDQNVKQRSTLRQRMTHDPQIVTVLDQIGPQIHSQDQRWRTILELTTDPEFDLILDTYGELYYAGRRIGRSEFNIEEFQHKIELVCMKLLPGGEAYIAALPPLYTTSYFENQQADLERRFGVQITKRQHHYRIYKPATQSTSHHRS